MNKIIKIVQYDALPCECSLFTINGAAADKSDFGYMDSGEFGSSFGELDDENWACANMRFIASDENKEEYMKKYNISEQEFHNIQDMLTEKFNIGYCGWCV